VDCSRFIWWIVADVYGQLYQVCVVDCSRYMSWIVADLCGGL